jgi:hypothetical protein
LISSIPDKIEKRNKKKPGTNTSNSSEENVVKLKISQNNNPSPITPPII